MIARKINMNRLKLGEALRKRLSTQFRVEISNMTLKPLEPGLFRDIILIFWFGALLSIAGLIILLMNRIRSTKKARFMSPTTGYMFFEMGFLIFIAMRGMFLFLDYDGVLMLRQ